MNSVFILLNSLNDWKPYCETDSLMTVTDYLEHRYGERTPKLVINLSDEYGYNSEGYYCSLLAQARGHRVLPGVETLNKLESGAGIRMNRNLQQLCQQWIERNRITDETWQLNIYFGTCREKGLEKIARFIFDHYPCPILRVTMNNHARNQIESVQALSLRQLSESGQDDFANALDCFNKKVWRSPRSAKPARYNLAILYDPDEKFPPSDKDALNKFLEVARKMNIHAELITEEEATRLMEFDALFIRATTALNHYTFRLAQRAAMNDIAVIDDPESIIRCTNKVYLCELFEKARIPAPAFTYYGKEVWEQALAALLCGENLLLAGGKATGKNVLAENLATAFGRPAWDISFHVNMDAASLIGMDTFEGGQVKFRPGPVYRCAQSGGFGVLDEINMAKNEALAVLHAVLDFRRAIDVPGYERIPLAEETRFIATMNYGYAGTRELNEALTSRFVVIQMPTITQDNLEKLLRAQFPELAAKYAHQFALLFLDLQKTCDSAEISTKALDLRGMLDALRLIRRGIPAGAALDMGITNKAFDSYEQGLIRDVIAARIPAKLDAAKLFA